MVLRLSAQGYASALLGGEGLGESVSPRVAAVWTQKQEAAISGCTVGRSENGTSQEGAELAWRIFFEDSSRLWNSRGHKLNSKSSDSWLKSTVVDGSSFGCDTRSFALRTAKYGNQSRLPREANDRSWMLLISEHIKCGQHREALRMYKERREVRVIPNSEAIFVLLLKACSSLRDLKSGREIHAHWMESGNELQVFVRNSLIDMYVKCGSMLDARHLFDSVARSCVVSWNVMILGYGGEIGLELYAQMQQEGFTPDDRTFVAALKACSTLAAQEESLEVDGKCLKMACLEKGRAIHSQLMKSGFELDIFVGTTLVDMYVKCGSMKDARQVFDKLPYRDVVSWNAMILGYAGKQEGEVALQLYERMQLEGVAANDRTFFATLKACCNLAALEAGEEVDGKLVMKIRCLEKGRAIHSQVIKAGLMSNVFIANTLIEMYGKCGDLADARQVFDNLPNRNVISWATMILAYADRHDGEAGLRLYELMQQVGIAPNDRAFVGALKACGGLALLEVGTEVDGNFVKLRCLEKGRSIHSLVMRSGFESDIFVGTTLVDMYTKCGSIVDARRVFDKLPTRNVASWTAMILGHVDKEDGKGALELFARMQQEGVAPDDRTFVAALKACSSSLAAIEEEIQVDREALRKQCLEEGRAIHAQVVKMGYESNIFVGNTLIDMYAKCRSIADAGQVFDKMPRRDLVSWNAIILGYAENDEGEMALQLYERMREEGFAPNDRTFVGALKACSSFAAAGGANDSDGKFLKMRCLEKGRDIHSQAMDRGYETDAFVGTALVDMYAKCGSIVDARKTFDMLPHRDVVSWNAMILGCAELGENEAALKLYTQMREQSISPDSLTFAAILRACGNASALEMGKTIHAQIRGAGLESTAIVANTLVDMYGKCGSMVDAQQLFDALPTTDPVRWNALIAGYARQGESEPVFYCFERLRQEKIQPNGLTFLSILGVCSHVGLVDKGHKYFEAMIKDYNATLTLEHYNCMVDLLGRAGQMEDAMRMVEKMPFQPNLVTWRTMLGACHKWKNVELATHAFECAVRLDKEHASAYVLMSNIYADAHMWEEVARIQAMRKKAGAWKTQGQSWWTDIAGFVHSFVVDDTKHPQSEAIYAKLKDLSQSKWKRRVTCVTGQTCE